MKLTCAIFLLCVVLYSEAGRGGPGSERFRQAKQKCAGDLGLSEDVIKPLFRNPEQEPSDQNVKCFFRCFMQEMGTMDSNGNITDPPDMANAPQGKAQAFAECRTVTGSNDCDKAFNFHRCFMARKPQGNRQH